MTSSTRTGVSFQNGASVECGLEHLWTIRKNRGKNKTVTLKDIKDNYYKIDKRGFKRYLYSVDYIEPVEYQQKNYFIDPYLLGILRGITLLSVIYTQYSK